MSMSQVVQDAHQHQINAELSASYQYLARRPYCEKQHLRGIARWIAMQARRSTGTA